MLKMYMHYLVGVIVMAVIMLSLQEFGLVTLGMVAMCSVCAGVGPGVGLLVNRLPGRKKAAEELSWDETVYWDEEEPEPEKNGRVAVASERQFDGGQARGTKRWRQA